MIELYKGYYKSILIAVSDNKKKLKKYLKDVRQLDDFNIESKYVKDEDIDHLYGDLYIVEFLKDLYVTQGDCKLLNREVQKELDRYIETLNSLRNYYNRISRIQLENNPYRQIKDMIQTMEDNLTNTKLLKKLRKQIIKTSEVINSPIEDYIRLMKYKKETDELDELYYYHLYGDN